MARIVLGVSGGIAAYKAALLLRKFTESGHDVRVVPTPAALEFVGKATWEALSGKPVITGIFDDVADVPHVSLGRWADAVVVAPATADLLAKAANGLADDLLSATLLSTGAPVVLAPAMHTEMWQHAATAANTATLAGRGVTVIEPDSGRLTGADTGPGRLPEPETIFAAAIAALAPHDLTGLRIVVSAGGTREPFDPVRFLGNRSSGRQGIEIAGAAQSRGADVRVVAAHLDAPAPPDLKVLTVNTAAELETAMQQEISEADIVIMTAAVADYRPRNVQAAKMKKTGDHDDLTIELTENPDVLRGLVTRRDADGAETMLVGFAAETGDENHSVAEYGGLKLAAKGCDLLIVNDVGNGRTFERATNAVTILSKQRGTVAVVEEQTKDRIAHAVLDAIAAETGRGDTASAPPTAAPNNPQRKKSQ